MLKYKNLIKNDEFLKITFLKSIFRKVGFITGFSYGINQKTKINNTQISSIGSGLIYGSIGLSLFGSLPLWILMNMYFFYNYKTLVYPDTNFIKYKSKSNENNFNKNDSIFYDLPIL